MASPVLKTALGFATRVLGESFSISMQMRDADRRAKECRKLGDHEGERLALLETIKLFDALPAKTKKRHSGYRVVMLSSLACAMDELQEWQAAAELYEEAISLTRSDERSDKTTREVDLALRLRNYGNTLSDLEEYEYARKTYEESLEIRRDLAGRYHRAFDGDVASTLQVYGRLLRLMGDHEAAEEALLEGLQWLAGREDEFAYTLAGTLTDLAIVYSDVLDYESAAHHGQQVVLIYRNSGDDHGLAEALHHLGQFREKLGDWGAAEANVRQAVDLFDGFVGLRRGAVQAELASCLNSLGNLLCAQHRHQDAWPEYERCLQIRRRLAKTPPRIHTANVANSLVNYASAKNDVGELSDARALCDEALDWLDRLAGVESEAVRSATSRAWYICGIVRSQQSDLEGGRFAFTKAIAIQEGLATQKPYRYGAKLAKTYGGLGTVLDMLGDYEASRAAFLRGLGTCRTLAISGQVEHVETLSAMLTNYSNTLAKLNADHEMVEVCQEVKDCEEQLAAKRARNASRGLASAYLNLGCSLMQRAEPNDELRAKECFEKSVRVSSELVSTDKLESIAELALSKNALGKLLIILGDADEGGQHLKAAAERLRQIGQREPEAYQHHRIRVAGDYAEALLSRYAETKDPGYLREACEWLQEAARLGESLRHRYLHPLQRRRLSERSSSRILLLLAEGCLELWMLEPEDESRLEVALVASERARVRALLDALQEEVEPENTPDELVSRLRVTRRNLEILGGRMEELQAPHPCFLPSEGGPGSREIAADSLEESLADIKAAYYAECDIYHGVVSEIRAKHDPLFDPEGRAEDVSFSRVRQAFPDSSTVAIQYSVTALGCYAILISDTRADAVRLPNVNHERLQSLAQTWTDNVAAYREGGDSLPWIQQIDASVHDFSRDFIEPLRDRLPEGVRRLVVAPHQQLHLFPWNAGSLDGRVCLADQYEVWVEPSLGVFCNTAKRSYERLDQVFWFDVPEQELAYREFDLQRIKSHYPGRTVAHTAASDDPAELRKVPSDFDIWHYSGHCYFNPDSPLESLLGPEGRAATLTLRDVFVSLRLPQARLAFLAACETGLVNPDALDDHVGFPQAFLRAGVGSVVSSLWKVDDLPTTLLVDRFYKNLSDGLEVAAALQQAQNWLRGVSDRSGECLADGRSVLRYLDRVNLLDSIELRRAQRRGIENWMKDCQDTPPFASPFYWAAFQAAGYPC